MQENIHQPKKTEALFISESTEFLAIAEAQDAEPENPHITVIKLLVKPSTPLFKQTVPTINDAQPESPQTAQSTIIQHPPESMGAKSVEMISLESQSSTMQLNPETLTALSIQQIPFIRNTKSILIIPADLVGGKERRILQDPSKTESLNRRKSTSHKVENGQDGRCESVYGSHAEAPIKAQGETSGSKVNLSQSRTRRLDNHQLGSTSGMDRGIVGNSINRLGSRMSLASDKGRNASRMSIYSIDEIASLNASSNSGSVDIVRELPPPDIQLNDNTEFFNNDSKELSEVDMRLTASGPDLSLFYVEDDEDILEACRLIIASRNSKRLIVNSKLRVEKNVMGEKGRKKDTWAKTKVDRFKPFVVCEKEFLNCNVEHRIVCLVSFVNPEERFPVERIREKRKVVIKEATTESVLWITKISMSLGRTEQPATMFKRELATDANAVSKQIETIHPFKQDLVVPIQSAPVKVDISISKYDNDFFGKGFEEQALLCKDQVRSEVLVECSE